MNLNELLALKIGDRLRYCANAAVVTRNDFTREVVGKAADGTPLYRKDLSLHIDDGTLDGVTLQSCHPHLGDFGKFTPEMPEFWR
jgi:hypothetical protein